MERTLWTDERLDDAIDRIEQRFDAVERRMDRLEQRMDRLEQRMDELQRQMFNGFLVLFIAIMGSTAANIAVVIAQNP